MFNYKVYTKSEILAMAQCKNLRAENFEFCDNALNNRFVNAVVKDILKNDSKELSPEAIKFLKDIEERSRYKPKDYSEAEVEENVELLEKYLCLNKQITPEEKSQIENFLYDCLDNKKINKIALKVFNRMQKECDSDTYKKDMYEFLRDFSYRSKNIFVLYPQLLQIIKNLDDYDVQISNINKDLFIMMYDINYVISGITANKIFTQFNDEKENFDKIKQEFKKIESDFIKTFKQQFAEDKINISIDSIKKFFRKEDLGFNDKLDQFLGYIFNYDFGHTGIKSLKKRVGYYTKQDITLYNALGLSYNGTYYNQHILNEYFPYSTSYPNCKYQFDIDRLVSQGILDSGLNLNKIFFRYYNSMLEIYAQNYNSKGSKIGVSILRNIKSFTSDLFPRLRQRSKPTNFIKIKDKFYSEDTKTFDGRKMICSEFVAKSIVAALVKTNEDICKHIIKRELTEGIFNNLDKLLTTSDELLTKVEQLTGCKIQVDIDAQELMNRIKDSKKSLEKSFSGRQQLILTPTTLKN